MRNNSNVYFATTLPELCDTIGSNREIEAVRSADKRLDPFSWCPMVTDSPAPVRGLKILVPGCFDSQSTVLKTRSPDVGGFLAIGFGLLPGGEWLSAKSLLFV